MSKAGKRILEAADELVRFAKGENVGPMRLHMPDGKDGLVTREVANMEEYRRLCHAEGLRVLSLR